MSNKQLNNKQINKILSSNRIFIQSSIVDLAVEVDFDGVADMYMFLTDMKDNNQFNLLEQTSKNNRLKEKILTTFNKLENRQMTSRTKKKAMIALAYEIVDYEIFNSVLNNDPIRLSKEQHPQ
jgi:hypothetical protein